MDYPTSLVADPLSRVESDGSVTDLFAKDRDAARFLTGLPSVLSGDVDLSSYTTETDQLNLESCAGNATADSIEILLDIAEKDAASAEGREPKPPVQVSRLFIYSMTRERIGELGNDAGTYIRGCFDTLSRFGVCEESYWPYDPSKVYTSPSLKAQRRAVGNKIHSYYKIKESSNRLDQIVSALRARHPVVFGTGISKDFMRLKGDAVQEIPSNPAGNHAMIIVGYFQGIGFLVKNSWGRRWGANGLCLMSPEYISWEGSFDFWVPTLQGEAVF